MRATITTYLTDVRANLEKSLRIAKAAELCAGSGRTRKGMEIALSLEPIVYELNMLRSGPSASRAIASMGGSFQRHTCVLCGGSRAECEQSYGLIWPEPEHIRISSLFLAMDHQRSCLPADVRVPA
jgi:hypothetical protein